MKRFISATSITASLVTFQSVTYAQSAATYAQSAADLLVPAVESSQLESSQLVSYEIRSAMRSA